MKKGKEYVADVAVLPESEKVSIVGVNPRYASEVEALITSATNIHDPETGNVIMTIDPNVEPKKWIMNINRANLGYGFNAEKASKVEA